MDLKLFSGLLLAFVLLQNAIAFEIFNDGSMESLMRGRKFRNAMDDLWKKSIRDEEEPPSIIAETFIGDPTTITGRMHSSIFGRSISGFEGIRYANAQRFELPVIADNYWGEQLTADHLGDMCPQVGLLSREPTGKEDCLYLHIYVPEETLAAEKEIPVMVFIHGGGFIFGDASLYMPSKLLEHDVVLVTIHYRLGTLGFFYNGNDEAPGNYALYDQTMALEWVKEHISDFGGDPKRVTVFGQSAGGVSASLMQLNPKAKGLMNGIISHSGSTLDVWSLDSEPMIASQYVAALVGCNVTKTIDVDCMKEIEDPYIFVDATSKLVADDRKNGGMGFRGVSPVVQGDDVNVDDIILAQHPIDVFRSGEYNKVPQMIGTVKTEGSFVVGVMYKAFLVPNDLLENEVYFREQLVSDIMNAIGVYDISNSLSISNTLEYCPDIDLADFEDKSSYCLMDMTGSLFLKAGAWETANLLSYYSPEVDVRVFSFEFLSDDSMFDWIIGDVPFEGGVSHADDLMYIFPYPAVMEDKQIDVMKRMTLMWANFATYGEPTPWQSKGWQDLGIPEWTTYQFEDTYYMLMRNQSIMQRDFLKRWTITVDEMNAGTEITQEPNEGLTTGTTRGITPSETTPSGTTPSGTTPSGTTPSGTTPSGTTPEMPTDAGDNLDGEYKDIEDEADTYMAVMITFIIATAISTCCAVYFYFKSR